MKRDSVPKPETLRIGLCDCGMQYRGRLHGQRVVMERRSWGGPRLFQLTEVEIPERNQTTALRLARCHAFLDIHQADGRYVTFLDTIFLRKDRSGRTRVRFGWEEAKASGWWSHDRPPSVESVIATLRAAVALLPKRELETWLKQMTPPDWKIPSPHRLAFGS